MRGEKGHNGGGGGAGDFVVVVTTPHPRCLKPQSF